MKTRSIALALLISLAPVVLPAMPAYAQGSDEASTKMARERFQEGVAYYDKGNYEAARASFLQAYALRKHPAVLLNLAQSCLRSNHALEAAKYFQQFLREHTSATAAQRGDAQRGLVEARGRLGHIEVSAPSGADIFVDDAHAGTMPLREAIDVDPGTHAVRSHGATDETVQVSVSTGQLVTARFGSSGPAVVPVPVPPTPAPPAASPAAPPKDEPADAQPEPAPAAATTSDSGKSHSLLAPPSNLTPVFIGGGIALVGFGTAIAMGIAKSSAQSSADSVVAEIHQFGGGQGVCSAQATAAQVQKFGKACTALHDDDDKVNTDALLANIGLGVGVAAAVFVAAYWVLGNKDEGGAAAKNESRPVVAPVVGAGFNGVSVSGTF